MSPEHGWGGRAHGTEPVGVPAARDDALRIRIGVLSAEHVHAAAYLEILASMPGVALVGLWDDDAERARAAAASVGIPAIPSAEALLEGVDGVVVTSANSRHRRLTELAAAARVHVLCEKPLATSVEDAEAMVEACSRAGVRLMTAFPMRWSPSCRALASMIRDGSVGDPLFLEGANNGKMPNDLAPWFVDPELSGGGAVTDHVVHLADLYRWMLGTEVVEVYAVANRILQERFPDVETGGLVSLRFATGALATIDCSWSRPRSYPTWGGMSVDVIGTGGAIHVDAFRQRLALYGAPDAGVSWLSWGVDADRGMLEEFAAVVRENREPAVSGVDGLRAVEIVQAAYRSIRAGAPVAVRENVA